MFQRFFRLESAASIVLLLATVVALVAANSPLADRFFHLWELQAGFDVAGYRLDKSLHHWINDGLMAVFFLLVGLEIKRELTHGELSSMRSASLPVMAAIGGMLLPALLYAAIAGRTSAASGWGIPMATDIAFALGALAVVARRIPTGLRVLLAATAIVDDMGAVLVIALFYTPQLDLGALGAAALVLLFLVALNALHVRNLAPYLALGLLLWVAVLESGLHATIAGILLAMTIPGPPRRILEADPQGSTSIEDAPLERLEHALLPIVSFGIVPLFAVSNAGVRLQPALLDSIAGPVSLGLVVGLVVGKQIGLFLFPWLAVRLRIASLPKNVTWRHLWGAAWLGGIGFTMSIFIADLALTEADVEVAKLAILGASLIAATGGLIVLRTSKAPPVSPTSPV